jgi:putative ABC transport system permease protein
MLLRDFRIGWRLLAKDRTYSAVVILGLAVGIAACFLLLGLVRHAFSYDRHVPQAERVHLLLERWNIDLMGRKWTAMASLPARDAALASGQPLLATAFLARGLDVRVDNQVRAFGVTLVDPAFVQIFAPEVLAGDLQAALTRPGALALTRKTAVTLFGREDVVGATMQGDGASYTVAAVLADQPAATTMPYEALSGLDGPVMADSLRRDMRRSWGFVGGSVYIKLLPGADPEAVLENVRRGLRQSPLVQREYAEQVAALDGRDLIDYRLAPLPEAYLDPELDGAMAVHGNRQGMLGLGVVALLILLLAATNYVNLATVRTLARQREIAMRKVLGASAPAVARQFLAESVLVCMVATLAGLLLAWLLLPAFADLVQREFDAMFTPGAVLATLALGLLLGLVAGAWPAWSALKVRPGAALAGRNGSESAHGLSLRRLLTVLQIATAMSLTAITLAVAWQTRHASTIDPGFDPAPLLLFGANNDMRDARTRALRDEIARLPDVAGVATSQMPFSVGHNIISMRREGGQAADLSLYVLSPEFFEVLGVRAVAGRLFDPRLDGPKQIDRVVINRSAARLLGYASPEDAVGTTLLRTDGELAPQRIVGVAPDLRHRSARDHQPPAAYYLRENTRVFTVRARARPEAVAREIEALWPRHFPNETLGVVRMQQLTSDMFYADDLRLARLLGASSAIAGAIAAFGIYVLAAYSVQRREKEIVLRKLYGASSGAIGRLVARETGLLVGAGALLGLPLAWLAIQQYLGGFATRAPIGGWTLALGLLLACGVTLAATLRHALAAMRLRPAQALRE